ncbi:restriction endonuclease [Tenacibaculum ovolyticum]|uniref:restriction endonuclease n=1 Tax=Tenacibaculum ovolyticum TaxID=104270 RepID=UPI0007ED9E57|nr:restriction endonuclease [Tenacibaculum ovolyticum]
MIYKTEPKDWKELQVKVGKILEQCSFTVEVEKNITTARGNVEADVYAEENIDDRKYSIICECKYWKSNIPQNYIYSLRTIINDIGINKGYLITTSGFQKGAIKSSIYTNIDLLTWGEFQKDFFSSWYEHYFYNKLNSILYRDYDQNEIQLFGNFELIDKKTYQNLIQKHDALQTIFSDFPAPILKHLYKDYYKNLSEKLPLIEKLNEIHLYNLDIQDLIPQDILNEKSHIEFLNKIASFATPIYDKLDTLNLRSIE